jgi:hypothetical protein
VPTATTVGRLLVNDALPEDLRDDGRVLDKPGLSALLRALAERHPEKYREVSHRLSTLGHEAAQASGGNSFGLAHMKKSRAGTEARARVEKALGGILGNDSLDDKTRNEMILRAVLPELSSQQKAVYEESLAERNPLALQVLSGSRGNKMNLSSLRGSDLLYTDHRDRPIPLPVLRSYSEGLTPAEYWAGAYGARKGVIDVKLATAKAGYLSKQLNQVSHRLVVTALDREDDGHGTPRGFPVDTDDPDNEGALLALGHGPYRRNTVVTPAVASHLKRLGVDRLLVRSPAVGGASDGGLLSRDVGVREKGVLPGPGEQIGLTVAQALSEPISQSQLCLAAGTLVVMSDWSTRAIETLSPGDSVMGVDTAGRLFPAPVVHLYDNGLRPVRRTWFEVDRMGRRLSLDSTSDHKLLAVVPRWDERLGAFTGRREVVAVGDSYPKRAVVVRPDLIRGYAAVAGYDELGVLLTYDIEVDHPDHLFLLASGLIVSNSSKHTGGVAGASQGVSGFDAINQLIQVPGSFRGAAHATVDGAVGRIDEAPAGGYHVSVDGTSHYVPAGLAVTVKPGDRVEAGDVLSEGTPNPDVVTAHKGIGEGRRYFVDAMRGVMRAAGVKGHRRNLEVLSRGLVNHVRLTDELGDHAPDDVIPYSLLEQHYTPREGYRTLPPAEATGSYLERPYLHYTIGTKVRPSVVRDLEHFGVKHVDVHDKEPPFQPEMVRGMSNLQHDPDWMTRMYGSGLKKGLLDSAHRGGVSDELGTSFVPALARAVDFGHVGRVHTPGPGIRVEKESAEAAQIPGLPKAPQAPSPPSNGPAAPKAVPIPKPPALPNAPLTRLPGQMVRPFVEGGGAGGPMGQMTRFGTLLHPSAMGILTAGPHGLPGGGPAVTGYDAGGRYDSTLTEAANRNVPSRWTPLNALAQNRQGGSWSFGDMLHHPAVGWASRLGNFEKGYAGIESALPGVFNGQAASSIGRTIAGNGLLRTLFQVPGAQAVAGAAPTAGWLGRAAATAGRAGTYAKSFVPGWALSAGRFANRAAAPVALGVDAAQTGHGLLTGRGQQMANESADDYRSLLSGGYGLATPFEVVNKVWSPFHNMNLIGHGALEHEGMKRDLVSSGLSTGVTYGQAGAARSQLPHWADPALDSGNQTNVFRSLSDLRSPYDVAEALVERLYGAGRGVASSAAPWAGAVNGVLPTWASGLGRHLGESLRQGL